MKTAYLEINIWLGKNGYIHVAQKGGRLHSTISNNPESKRYHPNLYMKLKTVLKKSGKWQEQSLLMKSDR